MENVAHRTWLSLAEAEERFLQQRSRVQWIECDDCNSTFFHKMMAARSTSNQIHFLLGESGERIYLLIDIQSHCVGYYACLLGRDSSPLTAEQKDWISSLTPYKCSENTKELLQVMITPQEIKSEVFALPASKYPGPDGYTGEFFRKAWDIVRDEFTSAVLENFRTGKILKQWNCTTITLVPKKTGAEKIGDFRPISCCNGLQGHL